MLSDVQQRQIERSQDDLSLWNQLHGIFDAMLAAFRESSGALEVLDHIAATPRSGDMSGLLVDVRVIHESSNT